MKNNIINQYDQYEIFQINVSVLEQLRMVMFSGYIYAPNKIQSISGFHFCVTNQFRALVFRITPLTLLLPLWEKKAQGLTVPNFTQYKN